MKKKNIIIETYEKATKERIVKEENREVVKLEADQHIKIKKTNTIKVITARKKA